MAENFPIDVTSVSEADIRADLEAFVEAQPDATQWTIFFESTTGQSLIKLISALGAFLKYESVSARREAYIQFAQNRSSQIGGAQYLGYSIFRGRNAILELTFTPNGTGLYDKYHILGTVRDRDLILLEETPYNAGVPLTVQVAVGEILEETLIAPNSDLNLFRYTTKGVSEDLRVFFDATEVEISDNSLDMVAGKFAVQSNPFGSVDGKYLNQLSFPNVYTTGTEIKLQWIGLKDTEFINSQISLDESEGSLTNVNTISLYQSPETESSIVVNAPLNNEVKQVIRARRDQPKVLLTIDNSIIDSSGEDVTAAVFRLYYLRTDQFLFDATEKAALISSFELYRPHAIAPPIIADPTRVPTTLKIDITLSGVTGDPITATKEITQAEAFKLGDATDGEGGELHLDDLEAEIEALDTVKIARVQYDGPDWTAATKYEIGQQVKDIPDDLTLKEVSEILYFSDGVEPVWPVAQAGETIVDGDIVWKSVAKNDTAGFTAWAAVTDYRVENQVKPTVDNGFIFQVYEVNNKSAVGEPVWTPLGGGTPEDIQGAKVIDGDILWIARPELGTPSVWVSDTVYKKGDVIIATDQGASDTIGVMFQAFAFLGTSGAIIPGFSAAIDATIVDENIKWITVDPLLKTRKAKINEYFEISESITVT
jgi:hypothetical protein